MAFEILVYKRHQKAVVFETALSISISCASSVQLDPLAADRFEALHHEDGDEPAAADLVGDCRETGVIAA
jgi:hypothetical protein